MSTRLSELVSHCNSELEVERFEDYCPNGLQVEGRAEVSRLACAVTANQSVLDEAVAWGADALLVHHGYFWRGEEQVVVGMKRRRLQTILDGGLSLVAYHLPLDAHPVLGNNAQFGQRLGVDNASPLHAFNPSGPGSLGQLDQPQSLQTLIDRVRDFTAREPLAIGDADSQVRSIAWCTGAAQGYIDLAAAAGADVYISGEISEQTVHAAREQGIAYIAAGHHASERYGVQALSESLAAKFSLNWRFIDCDNPA